MIINKALSNTYTAYKAKSVVAPRHQTFKGMLNTTSVGESSPKNEVALQPSANMATAPKVTPALVDALIAAEKSAVKSRGVQRETVQNFVLASPMQSAVAKANNEAFAASEAAKKNIPEPNTSLKWYDGKTLSLSAVQARTEGTVNVTVGKDEMLTLMENIEKALANGECYLTPILDLFNSQYHGVGYALDTFFLDPYSGEIKHASPSGSSYGVAGEYSDTVSDLRSAQNDNAVWDLAYDFQQFLKLRVFGETGDLSTEEVEKAIADIKARQSDKDTWRFDSRTPALTANNVYSEWERMF